MCTALFPKIAGAQATPPVGPASRDPPPSAGATAKAALARNATAVIRQDDLLLMATDLDSVSLTDALPVYGDGPDPLVPLGELSRLLDLDLTVNPTDGLVIGRIGQAQKPLTIDLKNALYRLAGVDINLKPDDVAVNATEIYMKASAIERFVPIFIKTDVEALQLHVHALDELPIQAREKRLAALRKLHPDTEGDKDESLHIASPYTLFTMPAVDVTGQVGASSVAPRFPRGYDIRLAGDMLYTGFQGFIGSDQSGAVSSVRLTFERHNANGGLLGPLNATNASAGDVDSPSLPVGPRGMSGRGFTFSTAQLQETSVFSHIDLRGELPVGYDVELYVNDVLRNGQRTPVNGRYEFLDVPLSRGLNVIRIVLNGPQGQRSETTRVVNVGGGELAKGKLNLQVGVVQQDVNVVNVLGSTQANATTSGGVVTPGEGYLRAVASAAYGLTNTVTLVGGAALFPALKPEQKGADGLFQPSTAVSERELATAGVRASLFGTAVQLDAAADSTKSAAVALGLSAQPFGLSATVKQNFYSGSFVDETVDQTGADKADLSHSEFTLDVSKLAIAGQLVPLTLRSTYDIYSDRSSTGTAGVLSSVSAYNVLFSGGLNLNATTTPPTSTAWSTTGNFAASTFYKFKWQLRANIDYTAQPKFYFNDFSVTATRNLNSKLSINIGVGKDLTTGGDTNFQVGPTWHTKFGDWSLNADFAVPSRRWSLNVNFAVGSVFDPFARRYVLTKPGAAQSGALAFQSFVDNNGTGQYGPGDQPVAHAVLEGGPQKVTTDENGRALLTGLGASASGHVNVNLDNIDQPYITAPPSTVTFEPRAGRVIVVPYPVVASSEVIVHVLLRQDGKLIGLSAVRLRLVRKDAAPIELSTEYDGSVDFTALRAGTYTLELDPEQAARLHMHLVKASPQIHTSKTGGVLPDLTLEVAFGDDDAAGSKPTAAAAAAALASVQATMSILEGAE